MAETGDIRTALEELATACAAPAGTTLAQVLGRVHGASTPLTLILLSLPFLTPIPLPGLSTPLGLVVGLLGAGLAVGRDLPLPRRLADRTLPAGLLPRTIALAARTLARLGRWIRPRWPGFTTLPPVRFASGMVIAVSGALLALPLPIPFTNSVPAWAIVLTAIALLYRDSAVLVVGWLVFAGSATLFAILGWLAWAGAHRAMG